MPAMETLLFLIAGFVLSLMVLWACSAVMLAFVAPLEKLLSVLVAYLDRPISLHRASESTRKLVFWRSKRLPQ